MLIATHSLTKLYPLLQSRYLFLVRRKSELLHSLLMLGGEPLQDSFFKFAEPELNFYGNEAVDIGHVAGGKNDS